MAVVPSYGLRQHFLLTVSDKIRQAPVAFINGTSRKVEIRWKGYSVIEYQPL